MNQAKKLGDIAFGRHIAENYTPYSPHVESTLLGWGATDPGLYTMSYNGQKYVPNAVLQKVGTEIQPISPTQSTIFESLRQHGLQLKTPATQGEFNDAAPLVSEAVQAMGIDESAKYRQLSRQTQIMNVLAGLYNNPNIAAYSGAYTAKTRRALRPEEMRALANQGTAEAMTIDPTAFPEVRKLSQRYLDIVNNLETEEGGVVFPRTVSVKTEDILNEANRMRTSEGTEEAMGHAGELLQYPVKLLRGQDGKPVVNDGAIATQALKDNQMLLIATHAADVYGSADRVLQAERQGLGELPARAKQYLQYIFFMRNQPWDLGEPMLGATNEGYPDLRTIRQQPQQQQPQPGGAFPSRGGTSPTPGDTTAPTSVIPTTTQTLDQALQRGSAVRGRSGPQVNVSPSIQPAYQWFYGALSADSASYPRILDKLDDVFGGTSEQIAASLEHYGFPKAIADSVRRFPSQANRHRRNLTEALRQARMDLLSPQQ